MSSSRQSFTSSVICTSPIAGRVLLHLLPLGLLLHFRQIAVQVYSKLRSVCSRLNEGI